MVQDPKKVPFSKIVNAIKNLEEMHNSFYCHRMYAQANKYKKLILQKKQELKQKQQLYHLAFISN